MTAGELLYYNNKIAKCYYSNSNGGRTTSSKERWGGTNYPYLIAQDDPYDNGSGGGHGVGLSQNGAKNRAAAGHSYKDILSFYFPGTVLVKQEENYVKIKCKNESEAIWLKNVLKGTLFYE